MVGRLVSSDGQCDGNRGGDGVRVRSPSDSLWAECAETLGLLLSASTMSKMICCGPLSISMPDGSGSIDIDFVQWIGTRLSRSMGLYMLNADGQGGGHHDVGMEVVRVLRLMQRVLYFAPPPIKQLFVDQPDLNEKGQSVVSLLLKLYRWTLPQSVSNRRRSVNGNRRGARHQEKGRERGDIDDEVHDVVLSVLVNLAAHCPAAKHVLCYGQRIRASQRRSDRHNRGGRGQSAASRLQPKVARPFLAEIVREAFGARTRRNASLLCFDLLDAMMLDVDGIAVLMTKQKGQSNLIQNIWNLMTKQNGKGQPHYGQGQHRRIRVCCIKLLRNVAMQSLGQSVLRQFLLPRNQRFDDMVTWLEIEDERFRRICCEFFRNLGFIVEFKTLFANHRELGQRIFTLILDLGDGGDRGRGRRRRATPVLDDGEQRCSALNARHQAVPHHLDLEHHPQELESHRLTLPQPQWQ